MNSIQKNWGECYLDHYEKYIGDPIDRKIYRSSIHQYLIQVLSFDGVIDRCRIFCSLGLTHYSVHLNSIAELFIPVDDEWDEVPYLVANALFYMIQKNMPLRNGVCIRGLSNIEPSFVERTGKTSIYITGLMNVPPQLEEVVCGDEKGKIHLATFITDEEQRYHAEHGAEKLEDVMEKHRVDPYHLYRPSCVGSPQ